MADGKKDFWDKLQIFLQPIGGLLTALAVASVGFFGSQYLEERQAMDSNTRLYAELMGKREQADSELRKEMFSEIITTFLKPNRIRGKANEIDYLNEEILAMELLAHNFHEVMDFGPLFKYLESKIHSVDEEEAKVELQERLEKVAQEVNRKQLGILEDVGLVKTGMVDFAQLKNEGFVGVLDFEPDEPLNLSAGKRDFNRKKQFSVEVWGVNKDTRELTVFLNITSKIKDKKNGKNAAADGEKTEADIVFHLGFFDFPMIDNTHLPNGERVAIVLKNLDIEKRKLGGDVEEGSAEIALVYFPGSRASLKEKPFYDEIIQDLVMTRNLWHTNRQ